MARQSRESEFASLRFDLINQQLRQINFHSKINNGVRPWWKKHDKPECDHQNVFLETSGINKIRFITTLNSVIRDINWQE